MDWKEPIGLPKAARFLAYSMPISASFLVAPTIWAHSNTVARSIMA